MSRATMTKEERIAMLRTLIDRQMEARKKLLRDLEELDEATRIACGEFMDLVAPRAPPQERETP